VIAIGVQPGTIGNRIAGSMGDRYKAWQGGLAMPWKETCPMEERIDLSKIAKMEMYVLRVMYVIRHKPEDGLQMAGAF